MPESISSSAVHIIEGPPESSLLMSSGAVHVIEGPPDNSQLVSSMAIHIVEGPPDYHSTRRKSVSISARAG